MVRTRLLAALLAGAVCGGAAFAAAPLPSPGNPFRDATAEDAALATDAAASTGVAEEVDVAAPTLTQPRGILLGPLDDAAVAPAAMVDLLEEVVPAEGGWSWSLMPQGLIYRPYLAGAKESRFRGVWHDEANDGRIWDITLGGQVGLVRYGTRGNVRPEGWQLGIEGAGLVRLDRDDEFDVAATDYRFGVPLTWGTERFQTKFAYYHLSSHVGDEFLIKNPGFDRLNYSRDVLVWGLSYYSQPRLRYYAEIGYGVYVDVAEPWETQFGVEWAPPGQTGARGAPFAAFHGHLREEVDYGGNFVAQTGWAWRRSPASGMFRLGVEYYNGKDDQFSFYDDSVQKFGFGMWYDY